jgi:hypothetical protein
MDEVSGATIMSSLDCVSSYYQLPINPDHVEYTGFTTPLGCYRFKRLPFGITVGVPLFSRVMNSIFREYIGKFLVVFLDDILCYSKTIEEHKEHLRLIFKT